MQFCHVCRHKLTEEDLGAGRCPVCRSAIPSIVKKPGAAGTIGDVGGGTIDIELSPDDPSAVKRSQQDPEDAKSTIEIGQSDTHDPPPATQEPSPKTPTIADRADMTIEFDAPVDPPKGSPTVDIPSAKSTQPVQADFTIDFGGDDPDLNSHMTSEWASAIAPDLDQGQTLRQSGTIDEFISKNTRSSLPVKNRSVRQQSGENKMVPLAPGDSPDYELLEMIGKGGMGVVYAATQSSIARTVAVKMLKPGMKAGDEARDKFISEAVVTGDLDHPNIVPIYDMGANEEGALFYSMKRVKGTPWDEVVAEKSLDENLNILMRVADAVAFAHAEGVVHRDLKPENVMLGDFGEVLVMDWGLARVTSRFRNADAIYQSDSLGGTPAYMAPEMARGPVGKIDGRSDVYLLGAMLYEIVGGVSPHSGRDVMQCLMAAANNKIDPIEQTGELVDIAMRAMQTQPVERYADVREMQAAIRVYQSHSESLILTANAQQNLTQAGEREDYKLFARALYGFQEALTLWSDNERAASLLEETQIAYAGVALEKEDFDLGISLLQGDTPEQKQLLTKLEEGKRERDASERRLKLLKRVATAAVAAFVIAVSYGAYEINNQKTVAQGERNEAVKQRGIAVENEQKAKAAEAEALLQKEAAVKAQKMEALQKAEAVKQEGIANSAAKRAREEEAKAKNEREKAVAAKQAEEYEAYVARIGLAAAKIDENAFDSAREILAECLPELRNWEWGRLNYLCGLSPQAFVCDAPVEAVAYSSDGGLIASGDWAGKLVVRDAITGKVVSSARLAQYVHAVSFSPDGKLIAAGCSDGVVRLVNAASGEVASVLAGHTEGVLSVNFSPDGRWLLSAGYDSTARLWDLASKKEMQRLASHGWWVWSARFSPDASRMVTASQDGKVIVWRYDSNAAKFVELTLFDHHEGPVYDAVFSPDGARIASAGYDNSVCLWSPSEVHATDISRRLQGVGDAEIEFQRLEGHRGPVRSLAFSADGRRLLSASYDNSLRLWDAATGDAIKTLRGHGSGVRACSFSPDGQWAASAGQDQRVRLWDIAGYEESRVLRGRVLSDHVDAVLSARFSADGKRIITASRDRSSKLWNAQDGSLLTTFEEGHEFLASSAVFFADGRRVATGAGDNSVRVWDVAAGAELFALRPTGRAAALAVSADGHWIATGGPNNQTRIWPAEEGAEPVVLSGHVEEVTAAAFSADGSLVATGDDRGLIRLWRLADGKWISSHAMRGHSRTITALAFTPGGGLVSSSGDNSCGQWNVETGKENRRLVLKHPDWVSSLTLTPDGQFAITACDDGGVRAWRLADAQQVAIHQSPAGIYTHVDLSPDGRTALLASSADRQVRSWEWPKPEADAAIVINWRERGGMLWSASFAGSTDRVLTVGGNDAQLWDVRRNRAVVRFSPHGAVSSAALSPDGRLAATGSWDNSVKLWDVESGRSVRKLEGAHDGYVNSVTFSPVDAASLLTASDDGTAAIWSLETPAGDPTRLSGHRGRVLQATYSSDGAWVLTVGADKTARLWDAQSGEQLRLLNGHEWAVLCGAISGDGSKIVTGSQDNTAIVWDTATGKPLQTLSGHTASVTSVAFSSDGARVLTGSQDRAAKLWDADTGKEILTLDGHTREVTSVAFSPDGRSALTASRDGAAMLWLAEDWSDAEPVAAAP